jgi:hypothetical protein
LKHPLSTSGESALREGLDYSSWVPEAEEPVRSLFKGSEADPHLRKQAALSLLQHFGTKYHAEVVGFALYGQGDMRDTIFKVLAEPPHARLSGIDPAVVRMGFWLLFDKVDKDEEAFARDGVLRSQIGASIVINSLETYLGKKFTPDYKSLVPYRQCSACRGWRRAGLPIRQFVVSRWRLRRMRLAYGD